MNSIIVCKFENITNQKEIEKASNKHFGNCIIESSKNVVYLDSGKAPNFCRVMGLYNRNDIAELEKTAEIMTKSNYANKLEKYDKKSVDLQKKLNQAKQLVKMEGNTGLAGVMIGTGTMNNEIIDNLDKKVSEVESDKRVAKVISKLNKHREKNSLLDKSRQYSITTRGGGVSSLVSIGVSTEPHSKNIHKIIDSLKNPDRNAMEQSMKSFVDVMTDLLKHANEIGILFAQDGKKSPSANSETKVSLKNFSAENLLALRDREALIITN